MQADTTKEIAARYGVLIEEKGIALRGLFIINPEGIVEQVSLCEGQAKSHRLILKGDKNYRLTLLFKQEPYSNCPCLVQTCICPLR